MKGMSAVNVMTDLSFGKELSPIITFSTNVSPHFSHVMSSLNARAFDFGTIGSLKGLITATRSIYCDSNTPLSTYSKSGIPFISTDTAGAVRAKEIDADAEFMAKNVDYIYTDDPRKNKDAVKLERIKASEVLKMNLKAIDATATAFCMANGMPIHIFGLKNPSDITKALKGESLGTIISAE